jgi:hypothetical protein
MAKKAEAAPPAVMLCTPRQLPRSQWAQAAETAVAECPANRPRLEMLPAVIESLVGREYLEEITRARESVLEAIHPDHLALLTTKYWGPARRTLGVTFLESPPADLKTRLLSHMNSWSEWCCISFAESRQGEVRITLRGDGYWSYLGTDILHIPAGEPTMCLEGFSMQTPESEYRRVVRHETGHTLGAPHEHMLQEIVARLDPQKTIAWGARVLGWDAQTVREQILTPIEDASLMSREPADTSSIMCYQLPAEITRDGRPVVGGTDLDPQDQKYIARVYPRGDAPPPPPPKPPGGRLFWVNLPRPVPKGRLIYFTAPADVPAGKYDWVPQAAQAQAPRRGRAPSAQAAEGAEGEADV